MLRFVQNGQGFRFRSHGLNLCHRTRYELRDASILSQSSRRCGENDSVFERTEEHQRCSGSQQVFQFMYVEKNLFYYKEILHCAVLRPE